MVSQKLSHQIIQSIRTDHTIIHKLYER